MKKLIGFFVGVLICSSLFAQSTSVFDAQYFNQDGTSPPIKIGKGFHINDVYMQTRTCFTPETCSQNKLVAESGGKKTSIKIFYTKDNKEFTDFRSRGVSGNVSFLNLFSFGGKKLEQYTTSTSNEQERIIFYADVDFGVYSFDSDPQLNADAKALLDQGKQQDFVKFYGTHYISGVRKESSVSVILTKKSSQNTNEYKDDISVDASAKVPYRGKTSFEIDNGTWANDQLTKNEYSVEVEINGPAIQQNTFKSQISEILQGNEQDKALAISKIIESAMNDISDPSTALPTQYYYTTFTLYGVDGLNWDEKKQKLLTKINESVISVYSAKTQAEDMLSSEGKNDFINSMKEDGVDQSYIDRIMAKYNELIPAFTAMSKKADEYLAELEKRYTNCSDVYCAQISCCDNESYLAQIKAYDLQARIDAQGDKLMAVVYEIAKEVNTPECEKKQQGIIYIQNLSLNPYSLYQADRFIQTLPGSTTSELYVDPGTYYLKASQDSGYMLYPTVNFRTVKITKTCEEFTIKVGFED